MKRMNKTCEGFDINFVRFFEGFGGFGLGFVCS